MNKLNYQKELEKILEDENNKGKKLFLHSCCAPCSSYVLTYLASYFDITVFYYNPNITFDEEYRHRVCEQKRLIEALNSEYGYNIKIIEGDYFKEDFYEASKGLENEPEGGARCAKCFRLRLLETGKRALENKADFFCSTLTISPLKNAELINSIGYGIEKELSESLKWLPSDFKKKEGYKKSIELSAKYDLYRQDYCGCEFSKREREMQSQKQSD